MLSEEKIAYSRERAGMLALSFSLPFELGLDLWDSCTSSIVANWDRVKYLDWLREMECRYPEVEVSRIEHLFSLIKESIKIS